MSRRTARLAEDAASAASEAARTLQARGQEVRQEKAQEPEQRQEPKVEREDLPQEKIVELRKANPHDQVMEEMYNRNDERHGLPKVDVPQETPPPVESPAPVEAAPVEQPPVEAPPQPEMVRVKVDGEEFDVPKTEIDEAGGVGPYRMLKAAENRLKKANEIVAEARRIQPPAEPPKPPISDAQFIKEKMDLIRFGTPDEGAAAMAEVLGRARSDPNVILSQAVAAMEHQIAVREFDRNFADVMRNPYGARLVLSLRNEAIQEATRTKSLVDWSSTYHKIGTEVRNAIGGQRPSQPQTPSAAPATTGTAPGTPSQVSEKEAKKASIVNPPTSAARAAVPAEPKPETREDVLKEMRKSRGLPTE